MKTRNIVFIATSLDGFIADRNGKIDWLNTISIPEVTDMGFGALIDRVDAIVMGRNTFDTVCSFDIEWPYSKPVFVLSHSLKEIPDKFKNKAFLIQGSLNNILDELHRKGYNQLYIDGGQTIQSFLKEELIDEMIITNIPILLGGGTPLFGELPKEIGFKHKKTTVFLDEIVQSHYVRKED